MKKNVLVFSGGSYPAVEIYYSLQHSMLFNPIAASSYDDHSQFIYKKSFNKLPYIWEEEFLYKFNELLKNENIELIIPTHDTIAMFLMENEDAINAKVVCSPYETTVLCRYKSKAYNKLKEFSFVPIVYKNIEEVTEYPVFCKKDIGEGSRDIHLIADKENFSILQNISDFLICEYLPGEEITIDCFTDRNRNLLFSNPRKRVRIMNGISARSVNIELTDELNDIVTKVNNTIHFRGYWFIQLKQDKDGKYKLLEICTRFAGTFNLSKNLDVNLPLLALCDRLDMDVAITPNNYTITSDKTYIDRYKIDINYERVYVDFDDTIIFNRSQYNTFIMMFLYQCINEGKEIVLITKHEYDLDETMKTVKLSKDIFNEIIIVPINAHKYKFMSNDKPSIFIDNSYKERNEVKEKLNMFTFDISNVESLIDWS
jgi:hypothetical protein